MRFRPPMLPSVPVRQYFFTSMKQNEINRLLKGGHAGISPRIPANIEIEKIDFCINSSKPFLPDTCPPFAAEDRSVGPILGTTGKGRRCHRLPCMSGPFGRQIGQAEPLQTKCRFQHERHQSEHEKPTCYAKNGKLSIHGGGKHGRI